MNPLHFVSSQPIDKILVADDAPDNRFLIEAILEEQGYALDFAEDGREALTKIEADPPQLVLLDVMMPEMDGYEVTRRVRQNSNLSYIPILLITAYEQVTVAAGLDTGADDFIRKPLEPEELSARVRSLLRLKHSIDERDRIAQQREDFVSRLTHDLRTPLVAADRMLHLITKGALGELPEPVREALEAMGRSNNNLLTMVNMLLEVYRYEAGKKPLSLQPVDLVELIREVEQELAPIAEEKGLGLELDLTAAEQDGGRIYRIMADQLELRRVVTNLVGNALKFTEQGRVTVRLRSVSAPSGGGKWVTIAVQDTGPGINPLEQAVLFESFRTSRHRHAGSGLGLNLCRRIVEAHQGKIEFISQVGMGSTFTVSLPAQTHPVSLNPSAPSAGSLIASPTGSSTVLKPG